MNLNGPRPPLPFGSVSAHSNLGRKQHANFVLWFLSTGILENVGSCIVNVYEGGRRKAARK